MRSPPAAAHSRQPPDLVAQIFRRPDKPYHQDPFDGRTGRPRWRNEEHAGGFALCDELLEVDPHSPDIARNQNPAGGGGDTENLRIGSAIGNYARGVPEIQGGLSSPQTSGNVGIEIRISLKGDPQAGLASLSFLRQLETLYYLRWHRMPSLDLLENMFLILQVSIYFSRMFQNKCDRPVNLG